MCAFVLCIVILPEPDTCTQEPKEGVLEKLHPVAVVSSYHYLCSLSTRRCGAHKTGALTETWSVLMKSRKGCTICTGGYVLFTFKCAHQCVVQ